MLIALRNFGVLILLCNLLNARFCIIKIQIIIVFKHIPKNAYLSINLLTDFIYAQKPGLIVSDDNTERSISFRFTLY